MYNGRIFCILLTLTLAICMSFQAAEAVDEITLSSSNSVYYNGDHVTIFGNVNTFFENLPITIQIYHESNLISVAQVPVATDGTFVASFYATGAKWKDEGIYTVRGQYTPTQMGEITFEFFSQAVNRSSAVFPISIPNSGTFDVGYTIRGGEVKDMVMNQERYSLVIETTTTSNGNIILKLPRDSFDAQNDDTDTAFIILISKQNNADADFIQVEYEEIAVSSDYRTIRIPLEEGDKWIEVIGTYVIPEFGTIVTMILLIAVTTTIIMSKSKFSVKYN
jgi:predicted secreted protein with PEFG-CTERM motif